MKAKKFIYFFIPTFLSSLSFGCPLCATLVGVQVREGIFNQQFLLNIFFVTLPFIILIFIAIFLYYSGTCKSHSTNYIKSKEVK
jgi:uncharacterized membrane protein YqaE (UPF0057 family)